MTVSLLHYVFLSRIPSIPTGILGGSEDGYLFSTDLQRKASYLVAMDTIGNQLTEHGCNLPLQRYYDSSFFLPFRLSHEINTYSPEFSNRIIQAPTVKNGTSRLYLEFNKPTSYVIR